MTALWVIYALTWSSETGPGVAANTGDCVTPSMGQDRPVVPLPLETWHVGTTAPSPVMPSSSCAKSKSPMAHMARMALNWTFAAWLVSRFTALGTTAVVPTITIHRP